MADESTNRPATAAVLRLTEPHQDWSWRLRQADDHSSSPKRDLHVSRARLVKFPSREMARISAGLSQCCGRCVESQRMCIYHGTAAPLPGSDRWQALSEAEQKAIYEDYAEAGLRESQLQVEQPGGRFKKTAGITPGPPLGLASAARTVRVRDGNVEVKNGPHLKAWAASMCSRPTTSRQRSRWLRVSLKHAGVARSKSVRPKSTGDLGRRRSMSISDQRRRWAIMSAMKASIRPDHRALAEALRHRVLEGAGETNRALREAVVTSATGGPPAQPPCEELARQIGETAYRTTDEQVAHVVRATGSEKAAFEVIFTAAGGAGLLRWRHAIDVLDEATDASS